VKQILVFSIILIISSAAVTGESVKVVTAQGEAKTKSLALEQAKRSAVEQGLGTVITSETLTKNFKLFSDIILSRANGFIKSYTELSCVKEQGNFIVIIEAEVTQIFDEILKDQAALDLLMQWMDKPRVMIIVDEDNSGEKSQACETELAKKLKQWRFDLVSRQQVEAIRAGKHIKAQLAGDTQTAASIANDVGAELLLLGQAHAAEARELDIFEGTGMKSVQAVFSAQIVNAADARILASYTTTDASMHISAVTAGVKALTKTAAEMADSLVAYLLRNASEEQVNEKTITLTIKNVEFREFSILKKSLSDIDNVSRVHLRSFKPSTGELAVEFMGKSEDLAVELDGFQISSGKFSVEEVAGNIVIINFVPDE